MIRRRRDLQATQLLFETAPSPDYVHLNRAEMDLTLPPLVFLRELTFSIRAEDLALNQIEVFASKSRSKEREGNSEACRRRDPALFAGVDGVLYPRIGLSQARGRTEGRRRRGDVPSGKTVEGGPWRTRHELPSRAFRHPSKTSEAASTSNWE